MIILLTIIHVIVCVILILVVLLQQGNAADWSGAFGGGGSQTVFGARGAGTILSKAHHGRGCRFHDYIAGVDDLDFVT